MLEEEYRFQNIEHHYNTLWAQENIYKWLGQKNNSFIIDTPPPTISGQLHIGHIFSYCHTDFIARFQRMLGKDVFYPIGFDDNGLPTERLVEQTYKIKAKDVIRSEFIKMCHQVIEKSILEFKQLFKAVGISYDWDLEYHTSSQESIILSQMSFIDLYNKGYAYKKLQPVLWDIVDKTAIAQAEIEEKPFDAYLYTISFFTEENEQIHIATTRPELLPSCVAVLCHPNDQRYTHLIGKEVLVPMIKSARVQVIADDKVKITKGTGLVMCSTFGDELDIYWYHKYNLPIKIIIDQNGIIRLIASSLYDDQLYQIEGLNIIDARNKIVEILTEKGLLISSTHVHHSVKCSDRSGAPLEILPTKQWFIKTLNQKTQILDKVQSCNWYPNNMRKHMERWIEGLNWDWCISRQRYFGVPFPVWYSKRQGEQGKIILSTLNRLPVNPLIDLPEGYSREEVIPEQDIMDTWATSAITPQLNAMALNNELSLPNHRYDIIFPTDLRSQSHEIIRTWAFYTILKSHYHANVLPWKNIMISGWCLSYDKKKMSKSKGNIITPHMILNNYGADVIRYWAANSKLGTDSVYSENVLKIGKRLITKLWNASKFIAQFIEKNNNIYTNHDITETLDHWILYKLSQVRDRATISLESFEYADALTAIETFFWKDFCNNYLELVKKRAYSEIVIYHGRISARYSLIYVLNILLRLFAPFIPYITDEIYHRLYSNESIHIHNNWPRQEDRKCYKYAYNMGENVISILNIIRKIKTSHNFSMQHMINTVIIKVNTQEEKFDYSIQRDLCNVCHIKRVVWSNVMQKGYTTENGKFMISIEE
ncbi:valine--tRNA ligase [Wolbachia endosymbiont of Howardula sp.]|uniref:valine--tRNA ligase n=1 Tax=Wolbachia endosymbiont of Howardula sp. TaxID=2916816 RepID=UPI00217CFC79|nr:valine--tRNA ligase [Wolbachia endosymbiont of Howardula sp.]UWI83010.1 valine--tRNA ligase [Wolbachia endosymbiont of Howardula sp.]